MVGVPFAALVDLLLAWYPCNRL